MKKINWRDCSKYIVHGDAIEYAMLGNRDTKYNLGPKAPSIECTEGITFFNYAELLPNKKLEQHVGIYEEIYYIIRGEGEFFVSGEFAKVKSGDAIYIPPGNVHGMNNNSGEAIEYICLGSTR